MRKPDLIIGPRDNPQTLRWQLFKFRGWQLCLHKWLRSDDDRALHDHSGDSISIILTRGYWDVIEEWCDGTPDDYPVSEQWHYRGDGEWSRELTVWRYPLIPVFRKAEAPHRVILPTSAPVWSLWFRWPPRREWGFHCPKGWKHWRDYLNSRGNYYDAGESITGPGCG